MSSGCWRQTAGRRHWPPPRRPRRRRRPPRCPTPRRPLRGRRAQRGAARRLGPAPAARQPHPATARACLRPQSAHSRSRRRRRRPAAARSRAQSRCPRRRSAPARTPTPGWCRRAAARGAAACSPPRVRLRSGPLPRPVCAAGRLSSSHLRCSAQLGADKLFVGGFVAPDSRSESRRRASSGRHVWRRGARGAERILQDDAGAQGHGR